MSSSRLSVTSRKVYRRCSRVRTAVELGCSGRCASSHPLRKGRVMPLDDTYGGRPRSRGGLGPCGRGAPQGATAGPLWGSWFLTRDGLPRVTPLTLRLLAVRLTRSAGPGRSCPWFTRPRHQPGWTFHSDPTPAGSIAHLSAAQLPPASDVATRLRCEQVGSRRFGVSAFEPRCQVYGVGARHVPRPVTGSGAHYVRVGLLYVGTRV